MKDLTVLHPRRARHGYWVLPILLSVCWAPTGRVHPYRLFVCFPVFKQMNRKKQIIAEDLGLLFLHHVSLKQKRVLTQNYGLCWM